jgi:hypothetical protein
MFGTAQSCNKGRTHMFLGPYDKTSSLYRTSLLPAKLNTRRERERLIRPYLIQETNTMTTCVHRTCHAKRDSQKVAMLQERFCSKPTNILQSCILLFTEKYSVDILGSFNFFYFDFPYVLFFIVAMGRDYVALKLSL